jgi:hypothetical protein
MPDLKAIIKAIRSNSDKDSKAYKVTEYYTDLTRGALDKGGIAIARSKVLSIEKELLNWVKEHPNNGATIMQPEEGALVLINDIRERGLLE